MFVRYIYIYIYILAEMATAMHLLKNRVRRYMLTVTNTTEDFVARLASFVFVDVD